MLVEGMPSPPSIYMDARAAGSALGPGGCLGSHPAPPAHYTDEQTEALTSEGTCPRSHRGQLVSGTRQVQILTAPTMGVALEGLLIFLSFGFIFICKMGVVRPT